MKKLLALLLIGCAIGCNSSKIPPLERSEAADLALVLSELRAERTLGDTADDLKAQLERYEGVQGAEEIRAELTKQIKALNGSSQNRELTAKIDKAIADLESQFQKLVLD